MTSQDAMAGSGFCLAAPGREYLVLALSGNEARVDLTEASGDWRVAWIHPVDGSEVHPDVTMGGGAARTFKPPFADDAILL